MQAIARADFSNNWLTLLFVFLLVLIAVMKITNTQKLYGYSRAFFLKGFITRKAEERESFFTIFNLLAYFFSILVYALFLMYLLNFIKPNFIVEFRSYLKVVAGIGIYFSVFLIFDFLLIRTFEIKHEIASFVAAKISYFYNIAILLFPFLIIITYSFSNIYILLVAFVVLFLIGLILIFTNNKKLIVNKLFYFILYLCALKIVPLLILYKITV
ncbi:MAG: DUF4271 domain-containing protein [Flavobacteriaceae bacterium]|nr:DUF4271 domain-containing protein [Flavobacteriaceae bacterium]